MDMVLMPFWPSTYTPPHCPCPCIAINSHKHIGITNHLHWTSFLHQPATQHQKWSPCRPCWFVAALLELKFCPQFSSLDMSSSSTISKSLNLSSALKMDQEETNYKKQGIVSILGFYTEREARSTTPLRRTISADMSSRKWLEQNSLASPIKKVASSEEFQVCMEDDQDEEDLARPDQSEVWNSILEADEKKELESKKQATFDVWSCILTQKDDHSSKNSGPAPYIHPLVNRTASSLNEKSLEVCTESLGSETGSDKTDAHGFASLSYKTENDKEEEVKQEKHSTTLDKEDFPIVKFHYVDRKKVQSRSFPPPLPTLSHGASSSSSSRASLHMRPRRDNGRLVLEAVSVLSQNRFHAQRQDGRLVLTFAETSSDEDYSMNEETVTDDDQEEGKELEEIFPDFEQDDGTEFESDEEEEEDDEEAGDIKEGKENIEYVMETIAPKLSSGLMNAQRQLLIASKPMALVKRSPTWTNKLNEEIKPQDYHQDKIPLAKSLPPRHPASRLIPKPKLAPTAASLNAYDYPWRAKLNLLPVQDTSTPLQEKSSKKFFDSNNLIANELQQLHELRGINSDRLLTLLNGCKESRRSLLFLEPHCIATS